MDVPELDPVFHQPTRFRIMVVMFRNRQAAATWLLRTLDLTDGNLRSHANKLMQAGHLRQARVLTKDGFQVRYRITPSGHDSFRSYLALLRQQVEAGAGAPVLPLQDGIGLEGGDKA